MINEIKIADYPDINWADVFADREFVQSEYADEHTVCVLMILNLNKDNGAPPELFGTWITADCYYYNSYHEDDGFEENPPKVIYRAEKRRMDRVDWCRKEMITNQDV